MKFRSTTFFSLALTVLSLSLQPEARSQDSSITIDKITSTLSGQAYKLAPGALITIKGENLSGSGTECTAPSNGALPTELCNTAVSTNRLFGDKKYFRIFSVTPKEIKLQVPYKTLPGRHSLCVLHGSLSDFAGKDINAVEPRDCVRIKVSPQSPALAVDDGIVRATHEDGSAVNEASPASIGEKITIVASGLGKSNPATEDGVPALVGATVRKPIARLGSNASKKKQEQVKVLRAEKRAGETGLDEIDIVVPRLTNLTADRVFKFSLQLRSGNLASNKGSLPIVGSKPSTKPTANPERTAIPGKPTPRPLPTRLPPVDEVQQLSVLVNNANAITVTGGGSYTLTAKFAGQDFSGSLDATLTVCQLQNQTCGAATEITSWGTTVGGSITQHLAAGFPAGLYIASFRPAGRKDLAWSSEIAVKVNPSASNPLPGPTATPVPGASPAYVCLDNIPPDSITETALRQSNVVPEDQICSIEWPVGVTYRPSYSAAFVNCKFLCCFGKCKPRQT